MNNNKNYETVKFKDDELELDVNVSTMDDTVWLTVEQIARLFERDRSVIIKHIKNILFDKELDNSTCAFFAQVQIEGSREITRKVEYYNLDMIISVGYRVKSKRGILFRKWATNVLKEFLLKGYAINENRVVVSNENYIELRNEVVSINDRLLKIEDKVFNKEYGLDKLFFNGQFYDAYTLIQSIFEKAKKEIIIIDNYIDRSILDRLVFKEKDIKVIIYTNINTSKINDIDINTFNKQYNNLRIINTSKVHDRFIIIDKTKLYHLGASIKDLGKKIFSISELDKKWINILLSKL
ncbi:MAG: virulence RhuM family protein [Bacilli bacterium]|nr:virulence RhuM family protein [Bacilli bacterium]